MNSRMKQPGYIEGLRCRWCDKYLPPRRNTPAAREGRVWCSRQCMYDCASAAKRLTLVVMSLTWHRPLKTWTCAKCGGTWYRRHRHECRADGVARPSSRWAVVHRCAVCCSSVLAPNPDYNHNRARNDTSTMLSRENWRWQCGHRDYYDAVRRNPMSAEWPE